MTDLEPFVVGKLKFSEEDNVELIFVLALVIEDLSFVEVNNLRKRKENFDCIEVEFAEDRMVVLEAQMAYIDLDFLA